MNETSTTPIKASEWPAKQRLPRKGHSFWKIMLHTTWITLILLFGGLAWFLYTDSGNKVRILMADTLITTQHRHWAKYIIGTRELQNRVEGYTVQFEEYAAQPDTQEIILPTVEEIQQKPLIEIIPIEGKGFKGHLLSVSDPKKIRLGVPAKYGMGEKVSSMVKRTGALAGVNGGGFVDPEWVGNGFQPTGIVMSQGKIYYLDTDMTTPLNLVGIDKNGRMVAGKYTPNQMLEMGVHEAVTFSPRFIVNGVGQIKNQADGWGIAPRTSMAQKEDGTILFAIIDGRQPTHSIGATLFDVQRILLEHGAVIAANLDGGSSTVLVHDNIIVNKPASEYGERYLPTAWLVFEEPEQAIIPNVWEGVDISKIDPSKWLR